MTRQFIYVALATALLAACATSRTPDPGYDPAASQPTDQSASESGFSADGDELAKLSKTNERQPIEPEIQRGSGQFINEKAARQPRGQPLAEDGEVTFNWEALPVQEVVHVVLGDLLQEHYVIGPGVSGQVTFSTARPISKSQVLPILEMILSWNNVALVYTDGRYHVLPKTEAIAGNLTPQMGAVDSVRGYEVRVVPLKYIAATEMEKLLEPYARQGSILKADNARSLIFLAGSRQELRNYMQTIEVFDVDWLAGMSVGVFPLTRVEVATVVPELEAIFGEAGESPLAGMFRFVPMERLNSVMVITPQPQYLDRAGEWLLKLDRASSEAGSRLYVYQVQNFEAAVLADYLSSIFGGGGSSSRRSRDGEVAPGLAPVSIDSFNQGSVRAVSGNQARNDRGQQGGISIGDGEKISVTAVEESNSLLIQVSPQQYDAIVTAIRRLDVEPMQVHIETQVLEVLLNENLEFGVNWFLSNTVPSEENGLAGIAGGFPFNDDENYAQFGAGPNFFSALTRGPNHSNFIAATISALDSASDVRVLSAPSLLVRNNEEANINVGESIAVSTTNFNPNNNTGGTIASNQYVRTGVELSVVPRVNPGGLVYIDVTQRVSSPGTRAVTETGVLQNPDISERSLTTKIAVKSGNTILLGGLIREIDSDTESGLPGVRRIPFVGRLFGTKATSTQRTELLVMITPTVVQTVNELNNVTEEYQKKFETLRPIRQGETVTLSTDNR